MSGFELLARLVEALAWPLTVLVVAIVLRDKLSDLLESLAKRVGRYTKISAYGVDAEFEQNVEETKEEVDAALEKASGGSSPARQESVQVDRLMALAELSPRAAILESYIVMEGALLLTAERFGWTQVAHRPGDVLGASRWLEKRRALPPALRQAVDRLRKSRNQAAHAADFELSSDASLDFVFSALEIADYLSGATADGAVEPPVRG